MERSDFDSRSGLMAHIFTREGLHNVLQARADYCAGIPVGAQAIGVAPSSDLPKLNTFCLFGRLLLEPYGTVSRINRGAFTDEQLGRLAEFGPVITWVQLAQFATHNGVDVAELVFDPISGGDCGSCSGGSCDLPVDPSNLPPAPGETCELCGGGWHLDNIGDYLPVRAEVQSPMKEFAGLTYEAALRQMFGPVGPGCYLRVLRGGDEFDLLEASQAELNDFLLHEHEQVDDGALSLLCTDDLVLAGDRLVHAGIGHVHASCRQKEQLAERITKRRAIEREFAEAFEAAGFEHVEAHLQELPTHIRELLRQQQPNLSPRELNELCADIMYVFICTTEGQFGFLPRSQPPMLDLLDSGIRVKDLHSEASEEEFLLPFFFEEVEMLRLWQVLVKKQQRRE